MKRSFTKIACILSLCLFLGAAAWAGDGQIDIATLPYTIDQPGSYIVTDELTLDLLDTNGITITTDSVTLDLNGHTLTGPGKAAGTTGNGIYVSSPAKYNIAIRNGTLRDWRGDGVTGFNARNSQFEALRCHNNGNDGIGAAVGCMVSGNSCYNNGNNGISAPAGTGCTVTGNTSLGNGGDGISTNNGCTVTGNTSLGNGGDGIYALGSSTVSGNTCLSNSGDGIYALYGNTVSGNTCSYNTGDGIQVTSDCRVVDNTCDSNGKMGGDGAGIHATSTDNRITNNHCTDNDRGLDLDAANNIVSGNTLIGNTTPVDAVAGNQLDILISELPYTISQPGMYRLSGDLSLATQYMNGITINADDVTLDLNGHSLTGPGKAAGTSGNGIYVNGIQYNIAIRNGSVRDWRGSGINSVMGYNSQYEFLRCYNNGDDGIYSGVGPATVSGNTCYDNGYDGIQTGNGCTVTDNACRDNGGDGIHSDNSTVRGNACYSNTGDGIEAENSLVAENSCMSNGTNFNLTTCTSVSNHP